MHLFWKKGPTGEKTAPRCLHRYLLEKLPDTPQAEANFAEDKYSVEQLDDNQENKIPDKEESASSCKRRLEEELNEQASSQEISYKCSDK